MEDELVITIYYEVPPRAEDVGELFTALARDYKEMSNGRVLVIASIEQGSIIAVLKDWAIQAAPYLKDAAEFAKGAKALADFGKLLKEWVNGAKAGKPKRLPYRRGRKPPGQRSIEAIVKIAAENGHSLRVKHTNAKGEILEIEMEAAQAVQVREMALADPSRTAKTQGAPRLKGKQLALPDLKRTIDRLYAPDVDPSSGEVRAIIKAVVEVLQAADLTHLIPEIAADLSSRGLHTLASALLAQANNTSGS